MALRHWHLALLLVGCLAFLLHTETINHDLVFDDHGAIKQNPTVTGAFDLYELLTAGFWGEDEEHIIAAWRPFTTLTFILNYAVHGDDPAGYHFVNILLHGVACVLLILLGVTLGLSRMTALMVGTLYAVHPIHIDTIAPAVGRADLLLAVLSFAGLLLWEKNRYGPAMVALVLALLSKEMGIVTLGVVIFRTLTRDGVRIPPRRDSYRIVSLIGIAALWLVARHFVVGQVGAVATQFLENPVAGAGAVTRFWTAGVVYLKVLSLLAVPHTLLCEYPYAVLRPAEGPTLNAVFGWVLLLGTTVITVVTVRQRSSAAVVLALWLFGFLLVSHLGPTLPMIFAERVFYLPSGGLFLALGFGIDRLRLKPSLNYAVYALIGIVCVGYGIRSIYRVRDWKDGLTLIEASVRDAPNGIKHLNRAVESLFPNGRLSRKMALEYIHRALRIRENEAVTHLVAAQFFMSIDDANLARRHIERAKEILPREKKIAVTECVFAAKYDHSTAVDKCRNAVKRNPSSPIPWGFLAISLDHRGESERAAVAFKLAIERMKTPDSGTYFNFGVFLARNKNYVKAKEMLSTVLSIDPTHKQARAYLMEIDRILSNERNPH